MSSEFYFFDQDSRRSHLGGVLRAKKNSKDYHQALQDQKNALSFENDEHLDEFPSRPKENNSSQIILPEILTKELDSILQTYEQHSNTDSSSSQRSKSPESDGENGDTDEENPNPDLSQLPKVSLPGSLIYQLHSTWSDLIQNTNYQYKVVEKFDSKKIFFFFLKTKDLANESGGIFLATISSSKTFATIQSLEIGRNN